jgi:hypothetical protein
MLDFKASMWGRDMDEIILGWTNGGQSGWRAAAVQDAGALTGDARMTALGNSSCPYAGLLANFLASAGGEYAKSFLEIRSCISRGSRSSCLGAQGKCAEIRK